MFVVCREPDSPFKAREYVSNHCPDWFCGAMAASTICACAARARADRQYFCRSGAATNRVAIPRGNQPHQQQPDDDERGSATSCRAAGWLPTPNRPPPVRALPAPGSVQTTPLAPASRYHRWCPHKYPTGIVRRSRRRSRGDRPRLVSPTRRLARSGIAAGPAPAQGRRAAGLRKPPAGDEVVTEPPAPEDHQQEGEFPPGSNKITGRIINFDEDIGEDRAVRRAAREDRRLLHAPVQTDSCQHRTPLSRSTRSTLQARELKRIF